MKRAAWLFVFCMLTGCGQIGGLYLPDEPSASAQPPPVTPAEPEEESPKKKK